MTTTTPASTRPRGRRHRRRLLTTLVTLVLALTALAACEPDVDPPFWPLSPKVLVAPLGPHVTLDWPDAVGATRYQIQVGSSIIPIDAPTVSACTMVGLAPATAYTFKITAYDAAGNWSGDLPLTRAPEGYRSGSYTTPSGAGGGATRKCISAADTDGDRAPNGLETATGTYGSVMALGTFPNDADSDDDGLKDGDEAFGTAEGLALPAFGVRPLGKDILLETDWATSVTECSAPDLRPTTAWLDILNAAFARIPLDGPQFDGVKVITDYGQGGAFTGGNAIPDANGRLDHDPFATYARTDNFAPDRLGYFHYVSISTFVYWSGAWHGGGLASRPGDDIRLGFGCNATMSDWSKARILMHELGHNLGLAHGGHDTMSGKPNYGSLMNPRFLSGADLDCDGWSDPGVLRFSERKRATVDENDLDEVAGVCPGTPADLDGDGSIDPAPYAADITGDGRLTELAGSNDLEHIALAAFTTTNRAGWQEIADPLP